MAQHRASYRRITSPFVTVFGQNTISEPFQPHEWTRTFDFLECLDELS